ncbi:hypothetical protein C2E23DRAFT_836331 [Lenzites betulinus]|nr:hypothetical protein C2E23DRAFT_836331 [Lenzites betulinus]
MGKMGIISTIFTGLQAGKSLHQMANTRGVESQCNRRWTQRRAWDDDLPVALCFTV